MQRRRPALGLFIYGTIVLVLGGYFAFSAIQGDYGVLKRVEIQAEAAVLEGELRRLTAEVAEMENLTRRLSDAYLDLDLLDEQARDVLGLVRADELVIR